MSWGPEGVQMVEGPWVSTGSHGGGGWGGRLRLLQAKLSVSKLCITSCSILSVRFEMTHHKLWDK